MARTKTEEKAMVENSPEKNTISEYPLIFFERNHNKKITGR